LDGWMNEPYYCNCKFSRPGWMMKSNPCMIYNKLLLIHIIN
jgi:hypothetical protein